jgi:hypothetical protein
MRKKIYKVVSPKYFSQQQFKKSLYLENKMRPSNLGKFKEFETSGFMIGNKVKCLHYVEAMNTLIDNIYDYLKFKPIDEKLFKKVRRIFKTLLDKYFFSFRDSRINAICKKIRNYRKSD